VDVDFVVNCYERTYRDVLAPGAIAQRAEQHQCPLHTTVVVNNVDDRKRAERLASDSGADRVVFVADHLERAMAVTGLPRRAIRRAGYFLDWPLVAVALDGPDHLVCWDAEIALRESADWITPGLEVLASDPRVLAVNPAWELPGQEDTLGDEEVQRRGDFALGYGFSDQAFLVRRSELARPIYGKFAPASWRYPLTGHAAIFERRVDAYMRCARRIRATYLPATYVHPAENLGHGYPAMSGWDRRRARAAHRVKALLDRPPFQHPALRTNPERL
jgi:hypothetical protein